MTRSSSSWSSGATWPNAGWLIAPARPGPGTRHERIAADLPARFAIPETDSIAVAYADLLT